MHEFHGRKFLLPDKLSGKVFPFKNACAVSGVVIGYCAAHCDLEVV